MWIDADFEKTEYFKNNEKRAYVFFLKNAAFNYRAFYLGNGYFPDKVGKYKTMKAAKNAVERFVENWDKKNIRITGIINVSDLLKAKNHDR